MPALLSAFSDLDQHHSGAKFHANLRAHEIAGLPILEDANSIQGGLAEVMRQLVTQEIDHRAAALLLYALQTRLSQPENDLV